MERPIIYPLHSMRKLEYLIGYNRKVLIKYAEKAGRCYNPFDREQINKDGEVKLRHIDNPNEELKKIQRRINEKILNTAILPKTMVGGIKGKSIIDHAIWHVDKPIVATLDIKNCFPSIDNNKVNKIFIEYFGCSTDIASLLTKLTTFQHRLPQGAPTSTMLANLALLPVHNDIEMITKTNRLQMSFYIDDIAISGEKTRDVLNEVIRIIQKYGYQIRQKKIKIMPSHGEQIIGGFLVNKKISIPKIYIEKIITDIIELSDARNITEYQLESIEGKISYVKRACKKRAEYLEKLYDELLPKKGIPGKRPFKDITRDCKNTKKHEEYK